MSTHTLDVSGARPLTTTTNDPARTVAQTPGKPGDDVEATLGNLEVRVSLRDGARVQRRQYIRKTVRKQASEIVRDDAGDPVYDEEPYEELILVLSHGASLFGRRSYLPTVAGAEPPTYESTPSTRIAVRRWGDEPHFLESGILLEEFDVAELVAEATA